MSASVNERFYIQFQSAILFDNIKEFTPLHFKNPDLHTTDEVLDSVEKKERVMGIKIANTPEAALNVYIERLENILFANNTLWRQPRDEASSASNSPRYATIQACLQNRITRGVITVYTCATIT